MATNARLNLKLSLPRPEFFHHKKSQPLPPTPEESEEPYFEKQEQGDSAKDATEWIRGTIREQGRWKDHLSLIRIDCPHTMGELRQLGRLSKPEGTRQCRKMIRIPVLYDEIGCFLWEKLAALERDPGFGREEEERAAEYAREVTYRTMMALDDSFRFDTAAAAPVGGTTSSPAQQGRPRQDSEPISPKHVQWTQTEPSQELRPNTTHRHHHPRPRPSHDCHFCQSRNMSQHPDIPDDIATEALIAIRGRVVDQHHPPSRGTRLSRSASGSSSRTRRPSAFFNRSRSSSYTSTLLWRHERHESATPSSIGAPNGKSSSRSSSGGAERDRRSRDDSLGGRVGSVVGNLGRGVATAIGGGLAHGHGYGGRADRSGSYCSV